MSIKIIIVTKLILLLAPLRVESGIRVTALIRLGFGIRTSALATSSLWQALAAFSEILAFRCPQLHLAHSDNISHFPFLLPRNLGWPTLTILDLPSRDPHPGFVST